MIKQSVVMMVPVKVVIFIQEDHYVLLLLHVLIQHLIYVLINHVLLILQQDNLGLSIRQLDLALGDSRHG